MVSHPLTNFEKQWHYQNEQIYSRNDSPNITKDRVYVINLDENRSVGTHSIALYVNGNNVTYFDSFGVEYISKKKFKNIHRQ